MEENKKNKNDSVKLSKDFNVAQGSDEIEKPQEENRVLPGIKKLFFNLIAKINNFFCCLALKIKNLIKNFSTKKTLSAISDTLDEDPYSTNEINSETTENTQTEAPLQEKSATEIDCSSKVSETDKVRSSFKNFFKKKTLTDISNALDEDVEEIESLSVSNNNTSDDPISKKRIYNKRFYFFVGIFFTFMSVIGLVSSVGFTVNTVKRFTDNAVQKEEFAKYIYPVAVMDLTPFDNPDNISNEHIITAAIWDLIIYGDFDKYEKNIDVITVPTIDIEQHAAKLFGTGLTFSHKSFDTSSITFYYNEEKKAYNIPISPTYYSYVPEIEHIDKNGKQYTLLVAYIRDRPTWLNARENEKIPIAKYMEFIVEESGDSYKILSLKNVSEEHNINAN